MADPNPPHRTTTAKRITTKTPHHSTNPASTILIPAAANMPYELVEKILKELDILSIIAAAPYVPEFWRKIIQNSPYVLRLLARDEENVWHSNCKCGPCKRGSNTPTRDDDSKFSYVAREGILYVHRSAKTKTESMIFIPMLEEKTLAVIDAAKTRVVEREGGGVFERSRLFFEVWSMEGEIVCSIDVVKAKRMMNEYVRTFYL
jgi:hypothetical protein